MGERYRELFQRALDHEAAARDADAASDFAAAYALPDNSPYARYIAATALARNAKRRSDYTDEVRWLRTALQHAVEERGLDVPHDAHELLVRATDADITDDDRRRAATLICRVRGEAFAVALDTESLRAELSAILREREEARDREHGAWPR